MFLHGREAYRRNSFFIVYNFYKNVLYVITQYYFGFNSAFSGQTLYEAFIYQLYNVTMTSLPIMWYAVFDFEFFKERYMKNPYLYNIGLEKKCLNSWVFIKWIFYALWQGLVIYFVCIIALLDPESEVFESGKNISFWASGHLVYGACVLVANLVILHKFNNYDGYGQISVAMMMIAYFLVLFIESRMNLFPVVERIFDNMFSSLLMWVTLFFVCAQATVFELMYRVINKIFLTKPQVQGYTPLVEESVHPDSKEGNRV